MARTTYGQIADMDFSPIAGEFTDQYHWDEITTEVVDRVHDLLPDDVYFFRNGEIVGDYPLTTPHERDLVDDPETSWTQYTQGLIDEVFADQTLLERHALQALQTRAQEWHDAQEDY